MSQIHNAQRGARRPSAAGRHGPSMPIINRSDAQLVVRRVREDARRMRFLRDQGWMGSDDAAEVASRLALWADAYAELISSEHGLSVDN